MEDQTKASPEEIQEQSEGANMLAAMFGEENTQEPIEGSEEPTDQEETLAEITPEIQTEMDDFQDLIDKGAENLTDEEKEKFEDYSQRYETSDEDDSQEQPGEKENEAWKDYVEEDILKLIKEGKTEEVTDDHIKYLQSLGHELKVEEPTSDKEDEEESKETEMPSYVDDLKNLEFFKGREFNTPEDAEKVLKEYIEITETNNSRLTEILTSTPELAGIIEDISKGKNVEDSVKRNFEELFNEEAPAPGDDGYEQYVEQKIANRKAKEQALEDKKILAKNRDSSVSNALSFVKDKSLNESQAKKLFDKVDEHMANISKGVISEELLGLVYKGMNYEKDLSTEAQKAEIRSNNRKITLQKSAPKGDGMRRVKRNVQRTIKDKVSYVDEGAEMLDNMLNG